MKWFHSRASSAVSATSVYFLQSTISTMQQLKFFGLAFTLSVRCTVRTWRRGTAPRMR